MYKKTRKITPLKLSETVRNELEIRKRSRGTSFIQSVEDAIMGRDRFNPMVEREIEEYQRMHRCSRPEAVEAMLIEAIAAKQRSAPETISVGGFGVNEQSTAADGLADDIVKRNEVQKPEASI